MKTLRVVTATTVLTAALTLGSVGPAGAEAPRHVDPCSNGLRSRRRLRLPIEGFVDRGSNPRERVCRAVRQRCPDDPGDYRHRLHEHEPADGQEHHRRPAWLRDAHHCQGRGRDRDLQRPDRPHHVSDRCSSRPLDDGVPRASRLHDRSDHRRLHARQHHRNQRRHLRRPGLAGGTGHEGGGQVA